MIGPTRCQRLPRRCEGPDHVHQSSPRIPTARSRVRLTSVTRQADRHDSPGTDDRDPARRGLRAVVHRRRQPLARRHGHDEEHRLRARQGAPPGLDRGLRPGPGPPLPQEYPPRRAGDNRAGRAPSGSGSAVGGVEHPHAFVGGAAKREPAPSDAVADGLRIESGIDGLLLLKTTDSAFVGFVRDRYTTLPEATDRILATMLRPTGSTSATTPADWDAAMPRFAERCSRPSPRTRACRVQQTLYAMGAAVSRRAPDRADPPDHAEQAPHPGQPASRSASTIRTRSSSPPTSRTARSPARFGARASPIP